MQSEQASLREHYQSDFAAVQGSSPDGTLPADWRTSSSGPLAVGPGRLVDVECGQAMGHWQELMMK